MATKRKKKKSYNLLAYFVRTFQLLEKIFRLSCLLCSRSDWPHLWLQDWELIAGFQHHGQMSAKLSSSSREDCSAPWTETRSHPAVSAPVCWETFQNITLHLFSLYSILFFSFFFLFFPSQGLWTVEAYLAKYSETLWTGHQYITVLTQTCQHSQSSLWAVSAQLC